MASLFEKLADLSIIERLSEARSSLLLANAAMYLDLVRAVATTYSIPPIPSPWGDATLIGVAVAAIIGLGLACSIAKVGMDILRQLWWSSYYAVRDKLAEKFNWNTYGGIWRYIDDSKMVSFHSLEMHLRVHDDKPAERVYEKWSQERKTFFETRNRCAVASVLLIAERFVNGSSAHIVVPQPHLNWLLWLAGFLVLITFAPVPNELKYIYMPGNPINKRATSSEHAKLPYLVRPVEKQDSTSLNHSFMNGQLNNDSEAENSIYSDRKSR